MQTAKKAAGRLCTAAGQDGVADARVPGRIAAAHVADDGKALLRQAAGAFQMGAMVHEQLHKGARHHDFALEIVDDAPQKVVEEIGGFAAVVEHLILSKPPGKR